MGKKHDSSICNLNALPHFQSCGQKFLGEVTERERNLLPSSTSSSDVCKWNTHASNITVSIHINNNTTTTHTCTATGVSRGLFSGTRTSRNVRDYTETWAFWHDGSNISRPCTYLRIHVFKIMFEKTKRVSRNLSELLQNRWKILN